MTRLSYVTGFLGEGIAEPEATAKLVKFLPTFEHCVHGETCCRGTPCSFLHPPPASPVAGLGGRSRARCHGILREASVYAWARTQASSSDLLARKIQRKCSQECAVACPRKVESTGTCRCQSSVASCPLSTARGAGHVTGAIVPHGSLVGETKTICVAFCSIEMRLQLPLVWCLPAARPAGQEK